jgi:dolichol-phosphate mannosyltransferase
MSLPDPHSGLGAKISIVIPIYDEAAMLPLLFGRLAEVLGQLPGWRWELVLVDDGSRDDSAQIVAQQAASFPGPVWLRRFSRNFGHQAALMAGLQKATGDGVIILDADLQDPPELFASLLDHFRQGYDVVYGVRRSREGGIMLTFAYRLFYFVFRRVAEMPIPLDAGDFGLLNRRTVEVLSRMNEHDLLLRGLRSWVGFRQIGIPYDRPARQAGGTKYTLRRLVRLAMSAFFGFSSLPLRICTCCGLAAVILTLGYAAYALYGKLVLHTNPHGWTSLIMVVLLTSGAQLISVGILGEYVARIYWQTLNRPLFVVAEDAHFPNAS